MPLVKAQCTNCGASLEVDSSKEAAICPHCNTPYIVEKAINNYTTNVTNNINAENVVINAKDKGDFTVERNVLLSYSGNQTVVVIPDSVKEIGKSAFAECKYITDVVVPVGVVKIGAYAFHGCSRLENINIPEGVTIIEDSAFSQCKSLKSIVIPSSVKEIGTYAFSDCVKLTSVAINGNCYVRDSTFFRCKSLKEMPKCAKARGCYVATCVYGSYDCPQVWTLRRYRDDTLGATRRGRAFIHLYYAVSPTLVKWFGKTKWFKMMWRPKLDRMVKKLNVQGVEDTPYEDKPW